MAQDYDPINEANERLKNALAQLKEARKIHKVFMSLGKELSLGSSQEVFLAIIVDAVKSLFPQTHFLVQLADPKSLMTMAVDYQGPLKEGKSEKMHISQSAMAKTRLNPEVGQGAFVEVCEEVPQLFDDSVHAIHVPLVAENQLFGAIQLEAPKDNPLGDDDELLLISLANQMAMALRNQRLLDETAYLKDYLANIVEYANALVIVTNVNRQILVFNRAMENLLGFPKNQTLSTDLFMWFPQEEHERFAAEISKTIDDSSTQSGLETRMRTRDGDVVKIIFYLAALHGRTGDLESIIMVGQDVTQLRSLESQIIEAEKMASLGKLAAGVVHELNNPLTSISVYAEYLVKKLATGSTDASDVEKIERILQGANRIQKLTRDLISYGRPSSEEPEPLQFNELVLQGLSFCEHTIRKYDICVTTDLFADIPVMIGNRNQLLQLIINLVTNACQAMKGGGELSLSTRMDGSDALIFSISDTGSGISDQDICRIFEPFYTTKKDGEGTGLGLSIVSRIVEHHRGKTQVNSNQGEGTSFEISLQLGGTGEDGQPG
ncbi:MAG: PAS domain S-box protein [Deltaproteobacteria bacterium]|nr:PAS domain S-box protein [Deltaproteobacteria bacterium]